METDLGYLTSVDEICNAAQDTLTAHIPAWLLAIADGGGPTLKPPSKFEQVPTSEALTVDAVPALAVMSPGLTDEPTRGEDGIYRATWRITVVAFVRAGSYRETQEHCRWYTAAIRAVMLQHPDLGGIADSTTWMGEDYSLIDPEAARTLAGGAVDFDVTVDGVVSELGAGSYTPLEPPPSVLDLETDVIRTP